MLCAASPVGEPVGDVVGYMVVGASDGEAAHIAQVTVRYKHKQQHV